MTARLSFGRDRRLLRRRDFELVFAEGVRVRASGFTLVARPGTRRQSRLGISVGKRYGNAVQRNRIKRLFREAFRIEQFEHPDGLDMVVVPRSGLRDARLHDLRSALLRAATRAARQLGR